VVRETLNRVGNPLPVAVALIDQFARVVELLLREFSACAQISRAAASRPSRQLGCLAYQAALEFGL
jgi:hypothetical protein